MCMSRHSAQDILFLSSLECKKENAGQRSTPKQVQSWDFGTDEHEQSNLPSQLLVLCCTNTRLKTRCKRMSHDFSRFQAVPRNTAGNKVALSKDFTFQSHLFCSFQGPGSTQQKCGIWCEDLCLSMVTKSKKIQSEWGPEKAGAKINCEVWVGLELKEK